jgi:hypothetical protein
MENSCFFFFVAILGRIWRLHVSYCQRAHIFIHSLIGIFSFLFLFLIAGKTSWNLIFWNVDFDIDPLEPIRKGDYWRFEIHARSCYLFSPRICNGWREIFFRKPTQYSMMRSGDERLKDIERERDGNQTTPALVTASHLVSLTLTSLVTANCPIRKIKWADVKKMSHQTIALGGLGPKIEI